MQLPQLQPVEQPQPDIAPCSVIKAQGSSVSWHASGRIDLEIALKDCHVLAGAPSECSSLVLLADATVVGGLGKSRQQQQLPW